MLKTVKKYRSLSFEDKTLFMAKISIILNGILAIGKFIVAFFSSMFLIATSIVNIFTMISKLQCYLGIKFPNKKSFEHRNKMIGIFLLLAGLEYGIYMGRLLYANVNTMSYNGFLAINIALVSFIEFFLALIGCFKAYGRGHYYRNLKLINLCSAFTAIALTESALMSFAYEGDARFLDGIFGICVGVLIVLIAIFVFIAPKVSIVDREYNEYKLIGDNKHNNQEIIIKLTNSKFYGNYYYKGTVVDNKICGKIEQCKSPIFKWNIYIKILVIVLSEILIFAYGIGALVFYFKNHNIIEKLDNKMLELNYKKI